MKIYGKWLTQTDTVSGRNYFEDMYEMTVQDLILDYKLDRRAFPEGKNVLVLLEYDGLINQAFIFEEGDEVFVWGQGCCDTVFNTDGIAVMEVFNQGDKLGEWVLDNSPFELSDDDVVEAEFDHSHLPEGIKYEQVVFVQQL